MALESEDNQEEVASSSSVHLRARRNTAGGNMRMRMMRMDRWLQSNTSCKNACESVKNQCRRACPDGDAGKNCNIFCKDDFDICKDVCPSESSTGASQGGSTGASRGAFTGHLKALRRVPPGRRAVRLDPRVQPCCLRLPTILATNSARVLATRPRMCANKAVVPFKERPFARNAFKSATVTSRSANGHAKTTTMTTTTRMPRLHLLHTIT